MSLKSRILVVDDEKDLVNLVRYNLEKEGFEVITAYDGNSVLEKVWNQRPHLIILDLMLPDRSGYDICKEIKADKSIAHIPVIMLTARSSEQNRVTGFESGAEDYVIKPFSPKELMLRVKAILARTTRQLPPVLSVGQIRVHPDEYRVFVAEEEITLTQMEFKILMVLLDAPNMVKTREQILDAAWQEEAETVLDRTVDAQVKRLRAKLGAARNQIETVRGIGYRLTAVGTPEAVKTEAPL